MALIDWKENYSVGVELLDEQHKGLVELINSLHDAMKYGKAKESLNDIITKLISYTATHFKSEEELFAKYNYPESSKHIEEHKNFVKEVLSFKEGFDTGRLFLSIEVMDFLKNWLISHILGSDKDYSPFLMSKGEK